MPGGDRRRFCGECGKFVHNAAAYSREELTALGPVCGYVGGESFGPPQSRRAVMAGALLTTIFPLLAQEGRVRVVVTNAAGTGVGNAEVKIGEQRLNADSSGIASFAGLPVGRVEIIVSYPGFWIWRGTFNVQNGPDLKVDAKLELGSVGGGGLVEPHSGRLSVTVSDPAKGVLVNAEVSVKCAGGASGKVRTDSMGVASFAALPVGECQILARAPGFRDWRGNFPIAPDNEARLPVQLEVSDPGTKVAVHPKPAVRRFWDWLSSCTRD